MPEVTFFSLFVFLRISVFLRILGAGEGSLDSLTTKNAKMFQ